MAATSSWMDLNCSHVLSSVRARCGMLIEMRARIIGQRLEHTWRPEVDHDVVVLLDHAVKVTRVQVQQRLRGTACQ